MGDSVLDEAIEGGWGVGYWIGEAGVGMWGPGQPGQGQGCRRGPGCASDGAKGHRDPAARPQDPEGKPKKASIRDNGDGTYTVSYVPDTAGRYTILITYGGDQIPYSPYRIRALPTGDASKCTVTGELAHTIHMPRTHCPMLTRRAHGCWSRGTDSGQIQGRGV